MKRYIVFVSIICSCLQACQIEPADRPTRERYDAQAYASESADGRVVFPLAMMETAFNIEAYQNASPEEKVQMTYIFNTLLTHGNSCQMKNFHSFYMTTDGKSIYDPGAAWKISAHNNNHYSSYDTHLTVNCINEGGWCMTSEYDKGQIVFNISQLPSDGSLFFWNVELSGEIISDQGRVMKIYAPENLTRKVSVSEWGCMTSMEGTLHIDVYDKDKVTLLDSYVYTFDGKETENRYYQL
jgi:hypothetical protein